MLAPRAVRAAVGHAGADRGKADQNRAAVVRRRSRIQRAAAIVRNSGTKAEVWRGSSTFGTSYDMMIDGLEELTLYTISLEPPASIDTMADWTVTPVGFAFQGMNFTLLQSVRFRRRRRHGGHPRHRQPHEPADSRSMFRFLRLRRHGRRIRQRDGCAKNRRRCDMHPGVGRRARFRCVSESARLATSRDAMPARARAAQETPKARTATRESVPTGGPMTIAMWFRWDYSTTGASWGYTNPFSMYSDDSYTTLSGRGGIGRGLHTTTCTGTAIPMATLNGCPPTVPSTTPSRARGHTTSPRSTASSTLCETLIILRKISPTTGAGTDFSRRFTSTARSSPKTTARCRCTKRATR